MIFRPKEFEKPQENAGNDGKKNSLEDFMPPNESSDDEENLDEDVTNEQSVENS